MSEPKKKNIWQRYIAYQRKKFPEKTLKDILKNYDKSEYAKFKSNPESFL